MYKAKIAIGEYKVGEEVPAEKAKLWDSMYKFSPIEKIEEDYDSELLEKDNDNVNGSNILEDYLARSQNVVKKNINNDNLTKEQLEMLLKIEISDKNRKPVILSIEKKLGTFN